MVTTTETLSLGIDTRGFIGGLRQAGRATANFKTQIQSVGKTVAAVGVGLTAAISLPMALISKSSIRAASDAAETASKFSVVFNGISSDANRAVNSLVNDYDLAGSEAKRLLGNTADLLTGFGFAKKEALNLSDQVNKLAIDLASFTNIEGGTSRASEALTKALLGEAESVKSLGIVINQNSDSYKKIFKEISKDVSLTQAQVKAYTALKISVMQSKNAIGDYARTRQQLANAERAFGQQLINLKEQLGKILIDTLKLDKVFAFLRDTTKSLVGWLKTLTPAGKSLLVVMSGLAAASGPLILSFGAMVAIIPSLISGYVSLKAAMISAHKQFVITSITRIKSIINIKKSIYWLELEGEAVIFNTTVRGLLTKKLKLYISTALSSIITTYRSTASLIANTIAVEKNRASIKKAAFAYGALSSAKVDMIANGNILKTVLKAVGTAIVGLTGPLALLAAGIAFVAVSAVTRFDLISDSVTGLWNDITPLFDSMGVTIRSFGDLTKWLWDMFSTYIAPIGAIIIVQFIAKLRLMVNAFRIGFNVISLIVTSVALVIVNQMQGIIKVLNFVIQKMKKIVDAIPGYIPGASTLKKEINSIAKASDGATKSIDGIKQSLLDAAKVDISDIGKSFSNIKESALSPIKAISKAFGSDANNDKGPEFDWGKFIGKPDVSAFEMFKKQAGIGSGIGAGVDEGTTGIMQNTSQLGAFQKGSAEELRIRSGSNSVQQTIASNSTKQTALMEQQNELLSNVATNTKQIEKTGVLTP